MKSCRIVSFLIAFACLVWANGDYDLIEYSNPTLQSEQLTVGSREVRTSNAKPILTKLTSTTLTVTLPLEGFYTVSIVSPNGRKLYSRTFALATGERNVILDGFSAPAGVVLVDIFGAGVRSIQKMTIQK